jgi:hypothetical protein
MVAAYVLPASSRPGGTVNEVAPKTVVVMPPMDPVLRGALSSWMETR